MMTVNEISKLAGISIRSLHYYDQIGLLPATKVTPSGYRLYDDKALERLQMILLFKELEFPLKEINIILDNPNFIRDKALEQQIHLLELKKEHLENLIVFANEIKKIGVQKMTNKSFEAFNTHKIDEYALEAKASWGNTDSYKEFEKKSIGRSKEEERKLGIQMMDIFSEFAKIKNMKPESSEAQTLVKKLQDFITKHYYTCTDEILKSLGQMYKSGTDMTKNIDKYAGDGTAVYASKAIEAYILSK